MSNDTCGEVIKATFERDDPKNPRTLCRFEVQYNPKDFSDDKRVAWTPPTRPSDPRTSSYSRGDGVSAS